MSIVPDGTLRIAVATGNGTTVDQHFGQATGFEVYDVTADGPTLVQTRIIADLAYEDEGPRKTVCRILNDCKVLLVSKIGINPQTMLSQAGIEALDLYAGQEIEPSLLALYKEKIAPLQAPPPDFSKFSLRHVMFRVADLERSLDFYTDKLGMHILERRDHQKNQFTQIYVGYETGGMVLELVFNWQQEAAYAVGEAYGHIAIEVTGITSLCSRLAAAGIAIPRLPRAQRHRNNIVAFIEDPDGHRIELYEEVPVVEA